MGVGEIVRPLAATAGDMGERGANGRPRDAEAGRGDTCKATSVAANRAGAGSRHGAKNAARESVSGRKVLQSGGQRGRPLGLWSGD